MTRLHTYIATHRKWIIGAALTAAASVAGYAWPHDLWIGTLIGVVAVGLGVNITPNDQSPAADQEPPRPAGA